jgi:hypothetical protein
VLRGLRLSTVCALAALAFTGTAQAAGGNYTIDGGTPAEQAQVRAALGASAFDWGLVRTRIAIHIEPAVESYAVPGAIWLDAHLLDAGSFSWGIVQHEYAHQVDFFMLDDAKRTQLLAALGGKEWCWGDHELAHARFGCERFASMIAWAYWPSSDNSLAPHSAADESAAMQPVAFRALLVRLLGPTAAPPAGAVGFAPKRR